MVTLASILMKVLRESTFFSLLMLCRWFNELSNKSHHMSPISSSIPSNYLLHHLQTQCLMIPAWELETWQKGPSLFIWPSTYKILKRSLWCKASVSRSINNTSGSSSGKLFPEFSASDLISAPQPKPEKPGKTGFSSNSSNKAAQCFVLYMDSTITEQIVHVLITTSNYLSFIRFFLSQ